jgi:hypothetical protein
MWVTSRRDPSVFYVGRRIGEAIGRFHQDEGRACDQAVVLQEPTNASLGYKAALRVREVDGKLARRQIRLLKGQVNDRRPDLVGRRVLQRRRALPLREKGVGRAEIVADVPADAGGVLVRWSFV